MTPRVALVDRLGPHGALLAEVFGPATVNPYRSGLPVPAQPPFREDGTHAEVLLIVPVDLSEYPEGWLK